MFLEVSRQALDQLDQCEVEEEPKKKTTPKQHHPPQISVKSDLWNYTGSLINYGVYPVTFPTQICF